MPFPSQVLGVDLEVQSGGLGLIGLPATSNADLSSAASQQYVQNEIATLTNDNFVKLATAAVLAPYAYDNGTSGVDATITFNSVGNQSVDGVATSVNDNILVYRETTGSFTMSALSGNTFTASSATGLYVGSIIGNNSTTSVVTNVSGTTITVVDGSGFANGAATYDNRQINGLYYVSVVGNGSTAEVWTRETYFDESAEMVGGYDVIAQAGSANISRAFRLVNSGTITVGTTAINFVAVDKYVSANAALVIDSASATQTVTVSATGALEVAIDGLAARTSAGVKITSNNIVADLDAAGGIVLNGTSLKAQVSNGVKITSNTIVADLDAAGALGLNSTSLKVNTGNGITITGNNVVANLAAAGPLYFNSGAIDLQISASFAVASNVLGLVFASTSETNAKSSTTKVVNPAGLSRYERTYDAGSFLSADLVTGVTVSAATHGLVSLSSGCWLLDVSVVDTDTGSLPGEAVGFTASVNQSTGAVTIQAGVGFNGNWAIRGL